MNSLREVVLAARSAFTHSSNTTSSIRRIASISGMQVSVTRFMWRLNNSCSSAASGGGSPARAHNSHGRPN